MCDIFAHGITYKIENEMISRKEEYLTLGGIPGLISQAFDKVWHTRLLHKIGKILSIIANYWNST